MKNSLFEIADILRRHHFIREFYTTDLFSQHISRRLTAPRLLTLMQERSRNLRNMLTFVEMRQALDSYLDDGNELKWLSNSELNNDKNAYSSLNKIYSAALFTKHFIATPGILIGMKRHGIIYDITYIYANDVTLTIRKNSKELHNSDIEQGVFAIYNVMVKERLERLTFNLAF